MKLHEVISLSLTTGKGFKRTKDTKYIRADFTTAMDNASYSRAEVMATDWEMEPEQQVTITKSEAEQLLFNFMTKTGAKLDNETSQGFFKQLGFK